MAGPTVTRWNDYVGTASADDAPVLSGSRSLYELCGLDRERWVLLGFDVDVSGVLPEVVVYAARRDGSGANLDDLVDAQGQVPVMAFHLAERERIDTFLKDAFGQVSISLRPRDLTHPIHVVERGVAPFSATISP